MVLIYIVPLFCMYYLTIANSIDEMEIKALWDDGQNNSRAINFINKYILSKRLNYLNETEIEKLLTDYGHLTFPHDDYGILRFAGRYSEKRLKYSDFKKLVKDGFVPRWPLRMFNSEFEEITKKGNRNYPINETLPDWTNGGYVTLEEMIKYYPQTKDSNLDNVMKKYGKIDDGEWRLYFKGFVRAMNLELIPIPEKWLEKKYITLKDSTINVRVFPN